MTKVKIITFEEHTIDKGIAAGSSKITEEVFPNFRHMNNPLMTAVPEFEALTGLNAGRIEDMNINGITKQILSISNQPQLLAPEEAIPLCQKSNDRLNEAVQAHPDRFAAFAALPWSDPEAAAVELERTVTELNFKGTLIVGRPSVDAVFLDDKRYWPVLGKAAQLKVPVYVHPGFPHPDIQKDYYSGFSDLVDTSFSLYGWGWHAEAGIQLIRMILSGVFDKYPDLQLIAGHWGEMVPFYLDRLDMAMPKSITGLSKTIPEYFREHIYVTPSGMFSYPQLKYIMEVIGVDRILYSVDYPYVKQEGAADFLINAPISDEDKEKIAHGNAEKLLKL